MASDKYNTYVPRASEYISRGYHSSAVLGSYLYIDGGQVKYNAGGTQAWELLNQTLAIDLTKDWTNSSLEFSTIDRGSLPLVNYPVLTPSAPGNALYSFGGTISFWVAWPKQAFPTSPELWKFTPDNKGGGQWSKEAVDSSFPGAIQPDRPVIAAGNGLGFMLGGEIDFTSYPQLDYGQVIPNGGLIQLNSSSGAWTNITSQQLTSSGNGFATEGGSHFVPTYGPEGLLITFGTIEPILDVAANASTAETVPMTQISIYEPQSRSWYRQTASGPSIPAWRTDFCIAGVPGDNGTYEIYIHGGTHWAYWASALNTSYVEPLVNAENQLDTIYILSLPSFTWHQASYPPLSSRSAHTCHITGAGNSQLLLVGGINFANELIAEDFAKQDVWAQGLGVFDLNELSWTESWKANAEPYKTPQMIKDYIATQGATPTSWDTDGLAAVFATSRSIAPSGTSTSSSTSNPKSESSTPIGAIAGGVVGGVLGLLAVGLLLWYCLRRRIRRTQPQNYEQAHNSEGLPNYQSHAGYFPAEKEVPLNEPPALHELPHEQRLNELPDQVPQVWEIDGANAAHHRIELPGNAHE